MADPCIIYDDGSARTYNAFDNAPIYTNDIVSKAIAAGKPPLLLW